MAYLDKDAWSKSSLKTDEVEVPELGGTVRIRELPAGYSAEVASNIKLVTEGREQVAKIDTATMERLQFAYGVIDKDGEPIFSEEEVRALQGKHGRAFKVVVTAIDELSGIDKEEIENTEKRFPASGESADARPPAVGDGASAGSGRPTVRA